MQVTAPQVPGQRRFRTFRAVAALMMREMESTYGRSPGGYIWAFLSPIGAIAMMTFVFSYILRSPGLGTNFPLFYATGFLTYQTFNTLQNSTAGAITYSRALLSYPAVSFVDAILARFVLNALTSLIVMACVIGAVVLIWDLNLNYDWPAILLAIAMTLCLGLGVGVLNCYLFLVAPVWKQIWAILMRPSFILSGVFFIPEALPPSLRDVLLWYPPVHLTSQIRKGFYSTYDAIHVDPAYIFGIAAVTGTFGLLLLNRHYKDLLLK
jgi:capsular polysaccharide transport system permease protein